MSTTDLNKNIKDKELDFKTVIPPDAFNCFKSDDRHLLAFTKKIAIKGFSIPNEVIDSLTNTYGGLAELYLFLRDHKKAIPKSLVKKILDDSRGVSARAISRYFLHLPDNEKVQLPLKILNHGLNCCSSRYALSKNLVDYIHGGFIIPESIIDKLMVGTDFDDLGSSGNSIYISNVINDIAKEGAFGKNASYYNKVFNNLQSKYEDHPKLGEIFSYFKQFN